jgi:hypothetical protein
MVMRRVTEMTCVRGRVEPMVEWKLDLDQAKETGRMLESRMADVHGLTGSPYYRPNMRNIHHFCHPKSLYFEPVTIE